MPAASCPTTPRPVVDGGNRRKSPRSHGPCSPPPRGGDQCVVGFERLGDERPEQLDGLGRAERVRDARDRVRMRAPPLPGPGERRVWRLGSVQDGGRRPGEERPVECRPIDDPQRSRSVPGRGVFPPEADEGTGRHLIADHGREPRPPPAAQVGVQERPARDPTAHQAALAGLRRPIADREALLVCVVVVDEGHARPPALVHLD